MTEQQMEKQKNTPREDTPSAAEPDVRVKGGGIDIDRRTLAYIALAIAGLYLLTQIGLIIKLALLGLVVYVVLVLTGRIQQVDPETHRFTTERDNAKRARVNLNLPAGRTQLRAGTHDGLLLDVTGTHLGGMRFHAEGDEERVIRLEPEPGAWQAWLHPSQWRNIGDTFGWDASLAKDMPLNLTLKARMGKGDMDLRGLNLSRLNVTCGMGEFVVRLPESTTGYDARIQGDLGKVEVYLPAATDVNLIASHSVGEFILHTGAGTAVQVDAKVSLGDIKVAGHLDEIDRDDRMLGDTGVWETDDYDTAPHRATVRFTGSVGSFKVD